jgi:hypothetical protein
MTAARCGLLAALLLCAAAPAHSAEAMFSVGNSLTLDCCGASAIAAFDASLGNSLVQQEHIRLGSALDYMVANPQDFQAGLRWNQALPSQRWDFLAVEPYPSATSTLATDLQAIRTLIAAARKSQRWLGSAWFQRKPA